VNWVILLLWWLVIVLARDWMHRLHGRWFRLGPESFDEAHYRGMAYFKVGVILFNFTPYLALRLFV
jgi:hypothetical protein